MAEFCALFSGSSGNCTYISYGGRALLVDAGVSALATRRAFEMVGLDFGKVEGILVTHEHSDHIKGLAVLSSRFGIPIYANQGTLSGILENPKILQDAVTEFPTGSVAEIAGMEIHSFGTSHDARESVGYRILTGDGKKIAVATDLGFISSTVMENLAGCDLVMLESNHDIGMLQNGRYPYYLKRRILSRTGHLSNEDCAEALPELAQSGVKHIVLAHLSKDNNYPQLALQTALSAMKISGIPDSDYEIQVAPRSGPGNITYL